MKSKHIFAALRSALTALTLTATLLTSAPAASKFKILHSFAGGADGEFPVDNLIIRSNGSLYGTTCNGGVNQSGTVFELFHSAQATWSEQVLHAFNYRTDGGCPHAGVIFDGSGDLYGTTSGGGPLNGTVFELTPGSSGWTFTLLYDWGSSGGLVTDPANDLYGLIGPGAFHQGAVAEFSPGSGGWTYTALYSFGANQEDGYTSYDGLTWDASGNLYGTTFDGGDRTSCTEGCGTVFEVSPGSGGWTESRFHAMADSKEGAYLVAGVVFAPSGKLYGAAAGGGKYQNGTVFRLTPNSKGDWKVTVIYDFPNPSQGGAPHTTPVFDKSGNLYGTGGGGDFTCNGGCGVVYKLTPRAKGLWKYTVLHKFHISDGLYPLGGLILDKKGHLYGTTLEGGTHGLGVVYEIIP